VEFHRQLQKLHNQAVETQLSITTILKKVTKVTGTVLKTFNSNKNLTKLLERAHLSLKNTSNFQITNIRFRSKRASVPPAVCQVVEANQLFLNNFLPVLDTYIELLRKTSKMSDAILWFVKSEYGDMLGLPGYARNILVSTLEFTILYLNTQAAVLEPISKALHVAKGQTDLFHTQVC
jgi:hypothetical protein